MIYYQLLIFWSKPIIQPTQLLAGMCRLYSLYSLYTFIYNIEQVALGFKAAISKPLTRPKIWDTQRKKQRNEQSHIYGGVLAHCLKIHMELQVEQKFTM